MRNGQWTHQNENENLTKRKLIVIHPSPSEEGMILKFFQIILPCLGMTRNALSFQLFAYSRLTGRNVVVEF